MIERTARFKNSFDYGEHLGDDCLTKKTYDSNVDSKGVEPSEIFMQCDVDEAERRKREKPGIQRNGEVSRYVRMYECMKE